MPEWDAEVEVDETLVRALLSEQFPELDAALGAARRGGLGQLGLGRRGDAGPSASRGVRLRFRASSASWPCCRELAPLLPVPIPEPQLRRRSERALPVAVLRSAAAARGVEPCRCRARRRRRGRASARARTLPPRAALTETLACGRIPSCALPDDSDPSSRHAVPCAAHARAARGAPRARALDSRRPRVEQILAAGRAARVRARQRVAHARRPPRSPPPRRRRVGSGVIDWGDMCRSRSRASTSCSSGSLLPPAARERFVEAYGRIDAEAAPPRARARALPRLDARALRPRRRACGARARVRSPGLERTLVD